MTKTTTRNKKKPIRIMIIKIAKKNCRSNMEFNSTP
jgi:hypothetical protein